MLSEFYYKLVFISTVSSLPCIVLSCRYVNCISQKKDIQRETRCFDEATGRRITSPLSITRLWDGAVPSILPNCPVYLSSPVVARESPQERRIRQEEKALQIALVQSVIDDQQHWRRCHHYSSISELKNKLDFLDASYWSTIYKCDSVNLYSGTNSSFECYSISSREPKLC